MEGFKKGYEQLYKTANIAQGYRLNKKKVEFNQLSHFVGMKGKYYDSQSIKLLVVGRAVNGWGALENLSCAADFSAEATEQFENNVFNWVIYDSEKGALRNDSLEDGKYYWLNNSPFWRTSKSVWKGLSNRFDFQDNESDKWVDYIAWTNLYKIAPKDTGNPTEAMAKKQLTACKEILKAEIEEFGPTHILFVTGYEGWFEDFSDIFGVGIFDKDKVKRNEYRGKNKNEFFAEASALSTDGIKIVVSCRPECRDENMYITDVMNAFS